MLFFKENKILICYHEKGCSLVFSEVQLFCQAFSKKYLAGDWTNIRLSPSVTGSLQPIRMRVRELNQRLNQTLSAVGWERSENIFLSRKAFGVVLREPPLFSSQQSLLAVVTSDTRPQPPLFSQRKLIGQISLADLA